jgi:glutathione S-transferase
MIDLHYWPTPNGHKITMCLEELGLPYRIVPVNIGRGEQFKPDFLRIAPNNRMPAIVDTAPADGGEPLSVFESGAILLYLGDKTRRYIPQDLRGRNRVLQWLFWQMGGLGPMAGQNHHFVQYAPEKLPYAIDRYVKETARLYAVLDKHLGAMAEAGTGGAASTGGAATTGAGVGASTGVAAGVGAGVVGAAGAVPVAAGSISATSWPISAGLMHFASVSASRGPMPAASVNVVAPQDGVMVVTRTPCGRSSR